MRFALTIAAAVLLAACQPAAEQAAGPTPEELGQDDPSVPFVPAPVGPPRDYEAMSKTAMSFTPGKLTITETPQASENLPSGAIFHFANGIEYRTTSMPGGATQGAPAYDWSNVIVDPNAPVDPEKIEMYGVDSETVPPGTPNGGLCEKTSFLAVYKLVSPGAEDITIAAFSGDQWPPAGENVLCGTFSYSRVH